MLAMKYSYKQIVLGDTKDRNSVMVAPLLVDKETSFIDPKFRFQKISRKTKNKKVISQKNSNINKYNKKFVRVKDYQNEVHGYVPHYLYTSNKVATSRDKGLSTSRNDINDVTRDRQKKKFQTLDKINIKKNKSHESFGLEHLFKEEMYEPKKCIKGNELFHKLMDQFLNFKIMNLTKKAQNNIHLHQQIHQDLKRISAIKQKLIYISRIDHKSFKFTIQNKIEMINRVQLQMINFILSLQKQNRKMKISHNDKIKTGALRKYKKMRKTNRNNKSYCTICNKKKRKLNKNKSNSKLRDFKTKHKATLRNFSKPQNHDYTNGIRHILMGQNANNRQFANLIFDIEYNPPSEHEENTTQQDEIESHQENIIVSNETSNQENIILQNDMELDESVHQTEVILQEDTEFEQEIPPNTDTNLPTDLPPLRVLNVTESFDRVQSDTINNANSTHTNSNATIDTGKIASDSFLSFFRQISTTQQNTIKRAISTFDSENVTSTPTIPKNNIISSTPKTHNILHANQDLLDSSDSDESTDQTTLIKNLVQSMNNFAVNQSRMLEHKTNPNIPYVPIISKLKKKSSNYTKFRQAKLTKKLIEAADRINVRQLKLFRITARARRLKYMHWIGDVINLLDMFPQMNHILLRYPTIQKPSKEYINGALYTFINSFIDLEGKNVIKESLSDGYSALLLLQKYCARITNADILTCEENFNNTKIFATENATKFISHFHDAYLLARSVGSRLERGKLIDKFLLSMRNCNDRYKPTVLNYQTQRRNETYTVGYTIEPLTLSEVEAALLSIDENTDTRLFQANFVRNKKHMSSTKSKQDIICYYCKKPGHIRPNCPLLKQKRNNFKPSSYQPHTANTTRQIQLTSSSTSDGSLHANMAKYGNAGRKLKHSSVLTSTPHKHDLSNWVMDSGCTCHMTPFKSDFLHHTLVHENKIVEVADGNSIPATLSGTINLHVYTAKHEKLLLTLQNVLFVPTLSRRLFSLMSLIEQGHDVRLSRTKGVQIYFAGVTSPVTLKMPNYHLFASAANTSQSSPLIATHHKNKQKIELDILYRRLGCRSIKTLLSANQDDLWDDSSIIIRTDLISSSDHDIATIRKRNRRTYSEPNQSIHPGQILCIDIVKNPAKCPGLTQDTTFPSYLLAVDKFSRFPFIVGLFNVKVDTIIIALQYIRTQLLRTSVPCNLVPVSRIQSDYGSVFTSETFLTYTLNTNCHLTLAAPKHLEMNSVLERTWQSLCHLKNTFIVQARVDESCTHFALLHATRIFSVIPIRTLRYQDKLITPYQLLTSRKPKLQQLRVLFCPCVVKKYSTTKISPSGHIHSLNIVKTFAQRGVRGMYVGSDDLTNGHLIFLPQTMQIISSVDVIFDENFLSALSYKHRAYREALLTRPLHPTPTASLPTERTGDISQSFLPQPHQHISPTAAIIEEENNNTIFTNDSSILNLNENIKPFPAEDVYAIEQQNDTNHHVENNTENESLSLINMEKELEQPTELKLRRSERIRKSNFRVSGKEWLNTVTEMNEENIPWDTYGDHTQYLPEPKGLQNVMRLEKCDPLAFKLWSRAIKDELRNLITQSTFSIEDSTNDDVVIPTTYVFKIKLKSDGSWDKAKARCCVRGDIQRKIITEDKLSATANKKSLRIFLAQVAKCGSHVFQLDFIGAFLQAPVRDRVFVKLDQNLVKIMPEYGQYFGRPLRLLKSMYGQTLSGKWWFLELEMWLLSEEGGFYQSECDQALFMRKESDGSITTFLTYVDDGLYFNSRNDKNILKNFEKQISKKFKVTFQGHAHWFLSMRILRDKHSNILLDQMRYAKNLVKRHLGDSEPLHKIHRTLPSEFVATKDNN